MTLLDGTGLSMPDTAENQAHFPQPSSQAPKLGFPLARNRPAWMTPEQYAAAPASLPMREVQVGGRILVTTLRDAGAVAKGALDELYRRRWDVELDLGCLKTTLGMDVLSCRTPSMIEKEIWVYLLAYNLIRVLMAQVAAHSGQLPQQPSFKHTVQQWNAWIAQASVAKTAADVRQ